MSQETHLKPLQSKVTHRTHHHVHVHLGLCINMYQPSQILRPWKFSHLSAIIFANKNRVTPRADPRNLPLSTALCQFFEPSQCEFCGRILAWLAFLLVHNFRIVFLNLQWSKCVFSSQVKNTIFLMFFTCTSLPRCQVVSTSHPLPHCISTQGCMFTFESYHSSFDGQTSSELQEKVKSVASSACWKFQEIKRKLRDSSKR